MKKLLIRDFFVLCLIVLIGCTFSGCEENIVENNAAIESYINETADNFNLDKEKYNYAINYYDITPIGDNKVFIKVVVKSKNKEGQTISRNDWIEVYCIDEELVIDEESLDTLYYLITGVKK